MKNYERVRADIAKNFNDKIEKLKLEIINLGNENTALQTENATLKKEIQKYKNQLNEISDSQKSLLGLTRAINHLI